MTSNRYFETSLNILQIRLRETDEISLEARIIQT